MRIAPLLILLSSTLVSHAQDPAVVDWMRSHAVPLDTVQAGNGFADMQPLKKVVGDARIVALGEATHGTREFFQMKHRMLEFLATEMGFNIFSIEANMPEAYRLNDYVLNGAGDPKELLQGMYFWTWNTEEVLDMILWMRDFNASGKGRLQFTGFDMQTPDVPIQNVESFLATADPDYYRQAYATYFEIAKTKSSGAFGVAAGTFPVSAAAGRQVRLSGYVKTERMTRGLVYLWWRADGNTGVLKFASTANQSLRGTTEWTRHELVMDVPAETTNINFGIVHSGDGTAWFDSLSVEVNGVPYFNPSLFDLGFESSTAKGFYLGGDGYSLQLDYTVAQAGRQSLRSQYLGLSGDQFADMSAAIAGHMDSARDAYLGAGYSEWEVDWAIQNARIVAQAMDQARGSSNRDPDMARNIKWILDHNPVGKIVLWAHNMHVAAGGYGNWDSMGGYLRKMYGPDMVVFGFAFNRGGFQAIDTVNGGLKPFEVPAAPEGTLDAAFAATGIPILALDLRAVPGEGLEAWLREPQLSRTVGSVYADDYASSYFYRLAAPTAFDAMLFVENTTRARPVQ